MAEPSSSNLASSPATRLELSFLDGIRGVAALAVVLYHAFLFTGTTGQAAEGMPVVAKIFGLGYLGVPVFIVLSGYVLMLPACAQGDLRLPKGTASFLRRRAKRILPPYYAALALTLVLIWSVPVLQGKSGTQWDTKVPITVGDVASHLLVVHDFSSAWIGKINGPLWSVAIEWHIYLLMPFVLLPLWRRFSPHLIVLSLTATSTALAACGIGNYLHHWFVPLFAAGMMAAQYTVRSSDIVRRRGMMTAAALVMLPLSAALISGKKLTSSWLTELCAGVIIAVGLAWTGSRTATGRPPAITRALSRRFPVWTGRISYSIYLVHSPLLGLGNLLLRPLQLDLRVQFLVMLCVVVPAALFICWAFFYLVERQFLNTHQALVGAAVSALDHRGALGRRHGAPAEHLRGRPDNSHQK